MMKYRELFTGENRLFADLFKAHSGETYTMLFGSTDPDSYALLKFGMREVVEPITADNLTRMVNAILDVCTDSYRQQFEVFSKQYDFVAPVTSETVSEKNTVTSEQNTGGTTKSDKAFADGDFVNDSKEDVLKDRDKSEAETGKVTVKAQTGNVTDAMMKEYRARLLKLREEIIRDLVSQVTLEIYL